MNRFDPELRCLYCKELMHLNEIDEPDDPIEEDSICMCNHCGEIMLFNECLVLRKPSPEELIEVLKENEFINEHQKEVITSNQKRCSRW